MKSVQENSVLQKCQCLSSFPITLCLSAIAGALALLSLALPVIDWYCFDYTAIVVQEEYWRLISGHLVHSSLSHAFWDISLFALLSAYLEKKDPQRLMMGITLAVVGLSAFMLTPLVEIVRYSGLSGVIYCLLIMVYWEWQKKHSMLIGLIPAVLVIGKTLMEWQSSEAVFVSDGWSVFVEAHLLGAAIGIAAILYIQFRKNSTPA